MIWRDFYGWQWDHIGDEFKFSDIEDDEDECCWASDYLLWLSYMDTLPLHSLCRAQHSNFIFAFIICCFQYSLDTRKFNRKGHNSKEKSVRANISRKQLRYLSLRFSRKRCRECLFAIGRSDHEAILKKKWRGINIMKPFSKRSDEGSIWWSHSQKNGMRSQYDRKSFGF